ncbi:MAG: LysM peptidoglycan-binding domain-containing protein [Clostridiales bacterium]|nr:LysM peptidoglycan-binding domain-containing protein [Clostridiales bacterium]
MEYIFSKESNLYGKGGARGEFFEFPTNVKQVGCLDGGIRIYMEDYVYTYLNQYAKTASGKEKLAVLAGKHYTVDGQKIVMISGAIQGKYTKEDRGVESFTDETWRYVNSQMETYFKDMEIVGWLHTQPGFGIFLVSRDEALHQEYFKKDWQVLFVIDPLEKQDLFYIYNESRNGLKPARGYFIYYDYKNEPMQDYMLENSMSAKSRIEVSVGEEEDVPETAMRIDAAKKIRKVIKEKREEVDAQIRRRYSFLAGISGVLCLACLLMSATILHSQDRLNELESKFQSVQMAYDTLTEEVSRRSGASAMVFATQNEQQHPEEKPDIMHIPEEKESYESMESQPETQMEGEKTETTIEEPEEKLEETELETEQVTETTYETYTVVKGDTLGHISQKIYGTTQRVKEIMELNKMEDPNTIMIGDVLKLPK